MLIRRGCVKMEEKKNQRKRRKQKRTEEEEGRRKRGRRKVGKPFENLWAKDKRKKNMVGQNERSKRVKDGGKIRRNGGGGGVDKSECSGSLGGGSREDSNRGRGGGVNKRDFDGSESTAGSGA